MAVAERLTQDRPIAAINITPLVDVMLVLLVIFMLAVPTLTRTLTTQIPQVGPVEVRSEPVALEVGMDGYRLDGALLSADQLDTALSGLVRSSPDVVVSLRASDDADYQAVAAALAAAERSGVRRLSQSL